MKTTSKASPQTLFSTRLHAVRERMKQLQVSWLLVRSTDQYLNEYVPEKESNRVWISGFSGSQGEVLIGLHQAYLLVDGRYWLQAEQQTNRADFTVIRVPLGRALDTELLSLLQTSDKPERKRRNIGFDPKAISVAELNKLKSNLTQDDLLAIDPFIIDKLRQTVDDHRARIRVISKEKVGQSVTQKLDVLAEKIRSFHVDGVLIQKLDDIAYLTNLRGEDLPYQSTFKSMMLATPSKLFLGVERDQIPKSWNGEGKVQVLDRKSFWNALKRGPKLKRVLCDATETSEFAHLALIRSKLEVVFGNNPVRELKAKKNAFELRAMKTAFQKADRVVAEASHWLCRQVASGDKVTEEMFADKVQALFRQAGAYSLSFKVISAAGKHGAVIHYGTPDKTQKIPVGTLMLLDTGAYFDEGYATDLTRTFLVGNNRARATKQQKFYYTSVLKAAISGMTAVFPRGTRGSALDAIVRSPLWSLGLDYNHGTGHGVGINVHEAPPRIGPTSDTVLEIGHVFSVEPGVYIEGFGGVRIENLCTVEPWVGNKNYLQMKALTRSPLDSRLIEFKMLTPQEKAWVKQQPMLFPT